MIQWDDEWAGRLSEENRRRHARARLALRARLRAERRLQESRERRRDKRIALGLVGFSALYIGGHLVYALVSGKLGVR